MKCTQCGAEIRPADRFCGRCGAPRPQLPPAFAQAQARMEQLQALYAAGQVDAAAFEVRRRDLTVQGPEGGYWSPGGGDTWYWYDGSAWVEREPPLVGAFTPAYTPPPPGAPVERPAAPAAPTTGRRRRPWRWVAVAGATLVVGTLVVLLALRAAPRWLARGEGPAATSVAAPATTTPGAGSTSAATPTPPAGSAPRASATSTAAPSPTPSPEAAPAGELGLSRAAPLPRTARVEFLTWELQVLDVLRGEAAWQRIVQDSPDAAPAPDGQEYLVLRLRARCKAVDTYSHSFGLYELYVTGDSRLVYTDRLMDVPAPELVFMDFYTAQQLEGWMDVLVGQDEHNLMLVLSRVLWGEDRGAHVRYVALEEGASLTVPGELAAIPPNDLGTAAAQPAPLGETVVSEDWEIAALQVLRGAEAWAFVQQLSDRNAPPEEGMEYALVEVRVRYIGAEDGARVVSLSSFVALAGDGTTYEAARVRSADAASTWMPAGLFPGAARQGWVPLQVPVEDEGTVLRFVPPDVLGGDDQANTRYLDLGP
ncbi:MAG: zinc-ribbon domain-containing protein [Anaerolineae bacterium]|nr:zinc-ribbon domain-containing protein [Anaerolineae bacterium]